MPLSPPAIDSHTHILSKEAMRLLTGESSLVAPRLKTLDNGNDVLEINGSVAQNPMPREIWDTDLRLRDMDAHGVAVQVLSPTVFTFFYHQEPALGAACTALQNEDIAATVGRHPDRFLGLGALPMQAPDKAADELRRAVKTLGLRGAMIGSNVNGRNLDDPALEPVWATAAELGAFIFLHPHNGAARERLGSYYLSNLIGLPFETTTAAASLVFGGVMERHPDLKICLSHGGGFVPYQAGRFAHGWSVRPEATIRLRGSPLDSVRRFYYDTIVHGTAALEFLVKSVGADHVLLGSDYPFDMGDFDCVDSVRALALDKDDCERILGGYAHDLLTVTAA